MPDETETPKEEKKPVIWGQPRVPNIKRGHNPTYPYYMMGIFVALAALSLLFAFLTD